MDTLIESFFDTIFKIAKNKKANPDYNANDARKYYNHLYNAKLKQYGKLKRQGNNINKNA